MEFKGTKGKWRYSKEHDCITTSPQGIVEGSKIICQIKPNVSFDDTGKEAEANALLISKAPEFYKEIYETIIDLKVLRNQILDASKTNHLFEGMPELIDTWIERKEQLIKEATEL